MEIRIRLPRLGGELASNLLGVAGLAGLVVAVGGLTGNPWWSVLAASLVLVALSYVAHATTTAAGRSPAEASRTPAAASIPPGRKAA